MDGDGDDADADGCGSTVCMLSGALSAFPLLVGSCMDGCVHLLLSGSAVWRE